MEALDQLYIEKLEEIKAAIQQSEQLETYLENEDEESYKALQETFEPYIHQMYEYLADHSPLQLEALEKYLLDDAFEGLYIPKILGYSILRGEIDENYRYRFPQQHFKDVLLAICNSANFEIIKNRIGQSIRVGFMLSSDIWVTHLIESIENKKVRAYLNSFRAEPVRDLKKRKAIYGNYKLQFSKHNFLSADFPKDEHDLKRLFQKIKSFLLYRATHNHDNQSLMNYLGRLIASEEFNNADEYLELLIVAGLMYDLTDDQKEKLTKSFSQIEKIKPQFNELFFGTLDRLHKDTKVAIYPENDLNFAGLLTDVKNKEIQEHFKALKALHNHGVIHPVAIDAVRNYYESHQGMSIENECIRFSVLAYFQRLLPNLPAESYPDFFEFVKIIGIYIDIFSNEKFNQELKDLCLKFVVKCINTFTDKRGKDYQDIRKFVSSSFLELGFLNEKEIAELFKTKRVKKVS